MKIKHIHLLFVVALLFFSCEDESKVENEISKVEVDFTIERFDKILASTTDKDELESVKEVFPFLLPKEIDSVWLEQLNSDLQKQIFTEADKNYGDFESHAQGLKHFFQHLKYYDNAVEIPMVITAADYVDYRTKLIFEGNLLIINLVNYLGENHEFYQNIPLYFAENMTPSQIIPDIANKYAMRYAYQNQRKTFLDEMIYHGKLLYFKDIMIPEFSDAEKIGYSEEDIKWATENEAQIWSYFVEKETLFSTDPKLLGRFTVPAPFSKFYLDIDNESPGRLGQYIGWQIVRAYAKRTEKDVISLMRTDSDEIFKDSKYKPKR
ncbi:gliding motility lipoprotein GldB [Winogradskyella jejuensis]|nr:gliding motility lipoprotein GldB [Winogradskyella jejuensis]